MFSIIELFFIGIALAVDCLTVSMTSAITLKKFDLRFTIIIAISFGIFQALMPVIGWTFTNLIGDFIQSIDHWIAFGLLTFIGWKMIKDKDSSSNINNVKSFLIIITLSIATSIDALAVGITFACVGYPSLTNILLPITIIGIISFLFALVGNILGFLIGRKLKFPIEVCGGIMLILIGVKILMDHLL